MVVIRQLVFIRQYENIVGPKLGRDLLPNFLKFVQ